MSANLNGNARRYPRLSILMESEKFLITCENYPVLRDNRPYFEVPILPLSDPGCVKTKSEPNFNIILPHTQ